MKRGRLGSPRLWIGLALSSFFAYLALRGMDPRAVASALKNADYRFLPFAFLLTYAVLWVRAKRWKVILRGLLEVETGFLFRITIIGFLANYVLPARIGELVRAALLGTRKKVSISAAIGTVVVERLLDLISILLIFFLVYVSDSIPGAGSELGKVLNRAAVIFLAVAVGLMGILWLLRNHTTKTVAWAEGSLGLLWPRGSEKLAKALVSFAQGLRPAQTLGDVAELVFWTGCLWVLSASIVILLMETFGLGLPWGAAWFILVALGFGVSVPSAPGFMGTFHFSAMGALLLYGVGRPEALSFAVVLHAICLVPVFLAGIPLLGMEGMSLGRIARLHRERPPGSGEAD